MSLASEHAESNNPTATIPRPSTASELAQETLGLLNILLPLMGANAGPVGLGISAAVAIAPSVVRLINRLAVNGVITAEQQAAQLAQVGSLLDFASETWTKPVAPFPVA